MNQKSRQESKSNIEKDFFKLMNNSNFGNDCRNILDYCDFVPIFDEIGKIQRLQKYFNLIDPKISGFVSGKLIKENVEEKYNDQLHKLDKNDPFYQTKLNTINHEHAVGLETAKSFEEKKKNQKRKLTLVDYVKRMDEANENTNVKSLIDFDD